MGQPNNVPNVPYEQVSGYVEQVQSLADAEREARERREQIGYRIDNYPDQTTGQQR